MQAISKKCLIKNKYIHGITLIALIITILVVIIISTSVIIILVKNNSIQDAEKIKFLDQIQSYETELDEYINSQELNDVRQYDSNNLNADANSITYNQNIDTSHNISDIINSLKNSDDIDNYEVQNGKLVYLGQDKQKIAWISDNINNNNIITSKIDNSNDDNGNDNDTEKNNEGSITVNISAPSNEENNTNLVEKYTLDILSKNDIKSIDLKSNIEVIDKNKSKQNVDIQIKEDNGNNIELRHKSYEILVNTNTLSNGEFTLILKSGAIGDINNNQNFEATSKRIFKIEKQSTLSMPEIAIDNQNIVNKDIVTIYTSQYGATILYSIGTNSNWQIYYQPFVVTQNTTIYSKIVYSDFTSDITSKKIDNIDNILPEVVIDKPSNEFVSDISEQVTYLISCYDIHLDKINVSDEYIQLIKTDTADAKYEITKVQDSNNKYIIKLYDISGNGKVYINIKSGFLVDIAKNESVEIKSFPISVNNNQLSLPDISINNSSWTNQNDKVIITYPSSSISNLYSIDGSNWLKYTDKIEISSNTTIYAKAQDKYGNSSASTLNISNIDKEEPSISLDKSFGTYQNNIKLNAILNDNLSGINYDLSGYIIDTQNSKDGNNLQGEWNKFNSDKTIEINDSGNWYIWIKAIDNAGNQKIFVSDLYKIQKNDGITITNPTNLYVKSWNSVDYIVNYDMNIYKNINLDSSYVNIISSGNAKFNVNVYNSGTNTRIIRFSNFVGDGKVNFNILKNSAIKIDGSSAEEISGFSTLIVDNTSPTINVIGPDKNIINSYGVAKYEIHFNDANLNSINLTSDNLQINKTGDISYNVKIYGDNDIKYIEFSNVTGNGNISFSIPYGVAKDISGNVSDYYNNVASFEIDNTNPIVNISKPNVTSVNSSESVIYDVYASDKNMSSFELDKNDIILYKAEEGNVDISIKDTNDIYHKQVILSNMTGNGNISIAIKNGVATDKSNNKSATTDMSESVAVDNIAPNIKISGPDIAYANSSNIVKYIVTYSDDDFKEAMLTSQTIKLNSTGTANAEVNVYQNGSNNEYIIMLYNIIGDGTLNVTIPPNTAIDKAGNYVNTTINSDNVIIDNTAPSINITTNKTVAYTKDNVIFTIEYKDENFDKTNLTADNLIINEYTGKLYYELNIKKDKNFQYIEFNNISGNGSLSISIPYGIAKDKASNVTQYITSQNVEVFETINTNSFKLKTSNSIYESKIQSDYYIKNIELISNLYNNL